MSYVPLHCHSEYSLLDGLSSAKAMAKHAKKLGLPAIALTDHGTMAGAVEFYEACKAEGVKPIIGFEAYVAPGRRQDKPAEGEADYYHLILLAKDAVGYQNLMALMTEAFKTGFYRKPRIDRQLLLQHRQGLIVLSGCLGGEVAQHLLKDNLPAARLTAAWYKQQFKDDYYLEIQDHGQEDDKAYLGRVVQLAEQLDIELVATPDSHYLEADDAEAAQILHCIVTHSTLAEPKFVLSPYGQYAIKPPEEMEALFPEERYPRALANTLAIAEKCNLELVLDERAIFPSTSHVTGGIDPMAWLGNTCRSQLVAMGFLDREGYLDRLEYELSIIEQTGFAEYIILVYDFVKWARDQGIPSVPRGSAAGSLILYLLGISDIDPLEYGLTFERFLNPERIQMPDVDMDFADERRPEVFEYLVGRYGADRVSQIVTFGQMRAKAAVKDTARVLGWAPSDANELTKLIPEIPVHMTISDCLETVVEFKALYDKDPKVRGLVDLARKVEGTARSLSVHAAGVVICGEPLTAHTPLQPARKDDVNIVTQYGQKSLEKLGLLKMDVLGLANLTMIERCLALIERHRGITLDVRTIPDRDPKTFSMLCRGETATCFQLEGGGMTRYVKELQPEHVRHLAVMVALYRPGPMALIPSFIARRHGREEVRYLHPDLEPILGETYGVLVYQDQVLRILETIAGYTKGQADIVRRAMGKKEADLMASEKEKFLTGAQARGYGKIASTLWDGIEPHAGYSFNKCVSGDTLIRDTSGRLYRIDDLARDRTTDLELESVTNRGGVSSVPIKNRLVHAFPTGAKPLFLVTTSRENVVKCTVDHKFMTPDGSFKTVKDIGVGGEIIGSTRRVRPEEQDHDARDRGTDRGVAPRGVVVGADPEGPEWTVQDAQDGQRRTDQARLVAGAGSVPAIPELVPSGCLLGDRDGGASVLARDADHRRLGDEATRRQLGDRAATAVVGRRSSADVRHILEVAAPGAAHDARPIQGHRQLDADRLGSGQAGRRPSQDIRDVSADGVGRDDAALAAGDLGRGWVHCQGTRCPLSDDLLRHREAPVGYQSCPGRSLECHTQETETTSEHLPDGMVAARGCGEDPGVSVRGSDSLPAQEVGPLPGVVGGLSTLRVERIVSIEPIGVEQTYNLTMTSPNHNYILANGLVTANSHATCYGMVAYQTAYLKAHYPFEWTAAVLQTKSFRPEDLPALIAEARTRNVPLLRPDINKSEVRFSVERLDPGYHDGLGLRYGLGSVKSVGEQTAQLIVDERIRGGPFTSLSDLLARANTSKVSSDILEALAKGGALDQFGSRESLLATIPDALKAVRKWKARVTLLTNRGQSTADLIAPEIVLYEKLSPDPARYLDWELEGLGLFLSDHPFAKAHGRITTEHTIESLKGLIGQRVESVAGAVTSVKELMTKAKKERMAIVTLADLSAEIDVVVFPRQYKETLSLWKPGQVLALSGEVDVREERLQLKAESAVEVEIH